jgi:hypothetical protein
MYAPHGGDRGIKAAIPSKTGFSLPSLTHLGDRFDSL